MGVWERGLWTWAVGLKMVPDLQETLAVLLVPILR